MITPTQVITVYAESTPNPGAMKFVANVPLIQGTSVEFSSRAKAVLSPLASELFNFPFVTNVFIASNYVTITKAGGVEWNDVILETREFIKSFLVSGKKVLAERVESNDPVLHGEEHGKTEARLSETEVKIIEVLNEYIKPAVEQDGGAIVFKSFNEGIVTVIMKGACSGCPSSTMTLKAGIEGLLKRMVPGVTQVVAEQA
jgi:Fe-S cluster biogenesis protein NfuA